MDNQSPMTKTIKYALLQAIASLENSSVKNGRLCDLQTEIDKMKSLLNKIEHDKMNVQLRSSEVV